MEIVYNRDDLKVKLWEKFYQAWDGITNLWGKTDCSMGQLVIHMGKNKLIPNSKSNI